MMPPPELLFAWGCGIMINECIQALEKDGAMSLFYERYCASLKHKSPPRKLLLTLRFMVRVPFKVLGTLLFDAQDMLEVFDLLGPGLAILALSDHIWGWSNFANLFDPAYSAVTDRKYSVVRLGAGRRLAHAGATGHRQGPGEAPEDSQQSELDALGSYGGYDSLPPEDAGSLPPAQDSPPQTANPRPPYNRPAPLASHLDELVSSNFLFLAFALLILGFRMLRLLMTVAWMGPLILMINKMLLDVGKWLFVQLVLVVSFAAALCALSQPPSPADFFPDACDLATVASAAKYRFLRSFVLLLEAGLMEDAQLECARNHSTYPEAMFVLMVLFQLISVVIMLNMLIAMMAKTFDNVYEAQQLNFMFLRAQTIFTWIDAPPAPPPFNLLSIPYLSLIHI